MKKWFYNFITKHHAELSVLAFVSIIIVADAATNVLLTMLPIAIILATLGEWGRHIDNTKKDEESL